VPRNIPFYVRFQVREHRVINGLSRYTHNTYLTRNSGNHIPPKSLYDVFQKQINFIHKKIVQGPSLEYSNSGFGTPVLRTPAELELATVAMFESPEGIRTSGAMRSEIYCRVYALDCPNYRE
jgi:hypothetical protein